MEIWFLLSFYYVYTNVNWHHAFFRFLIFFILRQNIFFTPLKIIVETRSKCLSLRTCLLFFLNFKICRTYSFVALGYQTWSKVDELSNLEAPKFGRKKKFMAHAMTNPINGFGIPWPLNLHIGSIFFIRGYLNIISRKKLFYVKTMLNLLLRY
jgi:hypothetical protein